jgi:hypothetical protein
MLDNTLILWSNELAKGNVHGRTDAPYLLAGKAEARCRPGASCGSTERPA